MKRLSIIRSALLFALLIPVLSAAQNNASLYVDGTVIEGSARLSGAFVRLFQGSTLVQEVVTKPNGTFKIDIPLDGEYTLIFGKDGYVSKKIDVNTLDVPEDDRGVGDFRYPGWKVELFPNNLGVDIAILDQPIGKVTYNSSYLRFENDNKYTKSIQRQLDQLIEDIEQARRDQERLAAQLDKDFELAVQDGDAFLKEGDYENAMYQYQAALQLKPEEKYPQKQLEKVREKMGELEDLEEQYAALLTQADDAFANETWDEAKNFYIQASGLKPEEKYPQEQIELCIQRAQDAETRARYDNLIAQADAAYDSEEFEIAKGFYQQALDVYPKEVYPKERIDAIDNRNKALAEQEAEYKKFMEQGRTERARESWNEAKGSFEQASAIFPDRAEPKDAIKQIEEKLAQLKAEYDALIAEADDQFSAQEWSGARTLYEQAKTKQPSETYPDQKIAEIEAALKGEAELEEQYASKMSEAAKLLASESYDEAKTAYQEAAQIKPAATEPPQKISEIDGILASLAAEEAARQQAESERQAQIKAEYDALIAQADGHMTNEEWASAQPLYEQASEKLPDETYPKEKLTEIRGLLAAQEDLEKQYTRKMSEAAKLLTNESYNEAKTAYQEAAQLKPEATEPPQKISEIDGILASLAAEEAARQQAEAERQAQIKAEYDALIAQADEHMTNEEWTSAQPLYEQASEKLPEETYPKEKLTEIRGLLAAQEDLEKQYTRKMGEAAKLLTNESYNEAKTAYQEAAQLKPEATEPPQKISEIDDILASLAAEEAARQQAEAERQAQIKAEYDALIARADEQMIQEQWENAKPLYEQALEKLPEETYPQQKISEIESLLAAQRSTREQYDALMSEANTKLLAKNYTEARASYVQASDLVPEEELPKTKITQIDALLAELEAEEAARKQAEEERLAKLRQEYEDLIREGDTQRDAGNYPQAIVAFEQASAKLPEESYPKEQLAAIRQLQADAAAQDRAFDQEIAVADKLFAQQQWEEAKGRYQNALDIRPEATKPAEQIRIIDEKLAALAAAEQAAAEAEQQRLAKIEAEYQGHIDRADASFEQNEWAQAITAYEAALVVKPGEGYPKERIALAQDKIAAEQAAAEAEQQRLAAEKARKAKYDQLVEEGDGLYQQQNYTGSKASFTEALALYPGEAYPQERIDAIDALLAQQAAEEAARKKAEEERLARENKYKDLIARAGAAFTAENYQEARGLYVEAGQVKPEETLPNERIQEIDDRLAELERQRLEAEKEQERLRAQEEKFNAFVASGDKAFEEEKYEKAKTDYESALMIKSDDAYAKLQLKKANDKIEELRAAAAAARANDTEFNYELARKYPQGRTEKSYEESNKTVTQIILVDGDRGDEYIREVYSWGQEFYLKNGKPYSRTNWLKETRK